MTEKMNNVDLLIEKYACKLHVPLDCSDFAKKILRDARGKRMTWGRNPRTLAASTLFMACLLKDYLRTRRTLKEFADISDLNPVTIREFSKRLRDELNLFEER
jgi:transcription initiation factor TFIIIB Brf1 subunit/transcription initiation factor TFIIB